MTRKVVTKNHKSRKLEIHNANKFYKLHDNDTTYEKWEPGEQLTKQDLKAHFGLCDGVHMILHTLLAMSDNEEDLRDRIQSKDRDDRIRNLTRMSIDIPSLLLSTLKPYNSDRGSAKADTKNLVKKSRKEAQIDNSKAVSAFHNKNLKKSASQTAISSDVCSGSDTSDRPLKVITQPNNGEMPSSEEIPATNDNGHVKTPVSVKELKEDEFFKNVCDGNCAMVEFYKNELLQSQATIERLTTEREESFKKFTDELGAINSKLAKVNTPAESEKKANFSKQPKWFKTHFDNGWQGVPLLSGEPIPEGKVHFGAGYMVSCNDLIAVEANSFDPRKRIAGMLEKIFTPAEELLQMFLDLNKIKDPEYINSAKQVDPAVVTTIYETLSRMARDSATPHTSRSEVSEYIRKCLYQKRVELKNSKKSPEEISKLKAERAAKAKESRKRKKNEALQKQREIRKKRSNKKIKKNNAIADSNNEDDEEESGCSTDASQ